MLLLAVLYGLVAMFAAGISTALLKPVTGRITVLPTVFFRAGISALTLLILLAVIRPTIDFSTGSFFFALSLAVLGYFPFMLFVEGLKEGKVGVVAPIASSWTVIAALIGFFVFGEAFPPIKLFAVGLIIVGVIAVSVDFVSLKTSGFSVRGSGIPFAIAAALLWGFVMPLFKVPSDMYGALFYAFMIETAVCLSALIHALLKKESFPGRIALRLSLIPLTVAGVLTGFYTFCFSQGLQTGEVGVVSALAGAGIAISVLAARILYKEHLTRFQYGGVFMVLLGIVFLSIIGGS